MDTKTLEKIELIHNKFHVWREKKLSSRFREIRQSNMNNDAIGRSLYSNMLNRRHNASHKNLVQRCKQICDTRDISLVRYVFNDPYSTLCKRDITFQDDDGLVDSVQYLLHDFNFDNRLLVQSLLTPFWRTLLSVCFTVLYCHMSMYCMLYFHFCGFEMNKARVF